MWKYIFNTDLHYKSDVMRVYEITIRASGYPMFVWNGEVYRVPAIGDDFLSQPLRIKVEEIK